MDSQKETIKSLKLNSKRVKNHPALSKKVKAAKQISSTAKKTLKKKTSVKFSRSDLKQKSKKELIDLVLDQGDCILYTNTHIKNDLVIKTKNNSK